MTPAYVFLGADEASLAGLSAGLFADSGRVVSRGENACADEAGLYADFLAGDPREALEALPGKLRQRNLELARVIALVDVSILEKRKELRAWFDLLAHFADVMLLANAKEVSPAWLGALKKSLKDRPLLIYDWPVKKSAASIVEAILTPEARRLTQYFDELPAGSVVIFAEEDAGEDVVDISGDDASREDGVEAADDDPVPAEAYFSRDAAGRYKIKIHTP